MTTRIPVTIEGNLTADPEHGASEAGNEYARFTVAINDRRLNETTGRWEDAGTVFHRVVVFNQQSRHVAESLRKGDSVLVAGDLRFGTYVDKESGQTRETRDVVADNVGASLKFASVAVDRAPKARNPEADASGPVVTPVSNTGVGIAR
ncbi:single-stranded DNA-binding protein [Microbacterium immunditiarum]|uniref:Single-stranded DNA-binding protein n=1 Tax=Microbacterium immunditiarum TaxID=337480 RepID=A0A7Y9GKA8_9MICO|nr:single-stranded DNA-binding protein [Microbacterium immunditiarum]NYE18019.1 single-strand DNA-binding protein [Microbacterium immunditiarum]